jgi:hypothetical protein
MANPIDQAAIFHNHKKEGRSTVGEGERGKCKMQNAEG